MTSLRTLAIAAATLLLAGCASDSYYDGGYGGGYGQYPNNAYGYDPYYDPYYGGGYGYGGYSGFAYSPGFDNDFDHDSRRYFHPDGHVTCDRKRDLCYDRYGPSYTATQRFLGERDANAAFHRYGDGVVLFSPQHGVTCDRRKGVCFDSGGIDDGLTDRYFGHHRSNFAGQAPTATRMLDNNGKTNSTPTHPDDMWWLNQRNRAMPLMNRDDNAANQRMLVPQGQQHMTDDNDDNGNARVLRPLTSQSDHSNRPAAAPTLLRPSVNNTPRNDNAPSNRGGGTASCLLNCESK